MQRENRKIGEQPNYTAAEGECFNCNWPCSGFVQALYLRLCFCMEIESDSTGTYASWSRSHLHSCTSLLSSVMACVCGLIKCIHTKRDIFRLSLSHLNIV